MLKQILLDYQCHGMSVFNPPFWAIFNYRYGNWVNRLPFRPVRWLLSKFYGLNLLFLQITCGIILPREVKIGEGFRITNSGNIRIHPRTVFGDNCSIMHDVTIGTNMRDGVPIIGNDVFIAAGAKLLGDITIGDGTVIEANSVVTTDVPKGAIAIGVPAKIIRTDLDN